MSIYAYIYTHNKMYTHFFFKYIVGFVAGEVLF